MRLVVALALATALVALPAHAQACTTSTPTATLATAAATFYLVLGVQGAPAPVSGADACQIQPCPAAIYLYQESGDLPGLQRDDRGKDDTNDGHACLPDNLII